jgi:hypothetical protein
VSSRSTNDFDDILGASERWMQAWQDQDRDTIEEILAPDFALVVASAPHFRLNREPWIELAVGAYVCSRFAYEHVQFHRLSDELVVMSAIADFDAKLGGKDRSGRFFVTDIWKKSNAGWTVCARYSSPPPEVDKTVTFMVGMERE